MWMIFGEILPLQKSQEKSIQVKGKTKKERLRNTYFCYFWGTFQEVFGRCSEGVQEVSGGCPGAVWEVSGGCLRGVQELSKR